MKGNKDGIQKNAKGKTKIDYIFITIIVVEVIFIIILFTIPTIKDWLNKDWLNEHWLNEHWSSFIAPLGTILVAIPSIYILNKRAKTAEKQVDNYTRQLEHELLKNGIEHLASENIAIRLGAIIELKGLHGTTIWKQAFKVLESFVRSITKEEEYIKQYVDIKNPNPREDIQKAFDIITDSRYREGLFLNLKGAKLAGAYFRNLELKGVDLKGAIMIGFEGLDRESIKLTGAINTDKIIWTEEELKAEIQKLEELGEKATLEERIRLDELSEWYRGYK